MPQSYEADPYPVSIADAYAVRGQTVIVTGASGWIGQKIAEAFAVNGATVIASDRAGPELDKAVSAIAATGHSIHAVPADLTSPEQLANLVTQAVSLGKDRLDSLIHCGALPFSHALMADQLEDFDRFFHTNVRSGWLLARGCVPHMKARGTGSIVNIASVNGHRPCFAGTLYTSSKAAVINMTQEIAIELAPDRIRANSISPGPVPNISKNMTFAVELLHEEHRQALLDFITPFAVERGSTMQPLRVSARPIDIAMACIYLCSPAARVITGTDILIDGGYILGFPEHGRDPFWEKVREYLSQLPESAWRKPQPEWLHRHRK